MKKLICKCSEQCGTWAPLVLRLAVGFIFLAHGYQKYTGGVENIAGFFGSVGIPAALFFAYLVTYLELIGGSLLILGFLTHWVTKLFAIEMAVAFFLVHMDQGIFVQNGGFELVLLLFAGSISLMVTGGGKWSLEDAIWKKS